MSVLCGDANVRSVFPRSKVGAWGGNLGYLQGSRCCAEEMGVRTRLVGWWLV